MTKRVKSETVGPYVGYWIRYDGKIESRDTGTILTVHKNGCVSLLNGDTNRKELVSAHKIIAQAFIPNEEGHKFVKFISDDKTNTAVNNLKWSKSAKDTTGIEEEDVIKLRLMGYPAKTIADTFGVTPQYVHKILRDNGIVKSRQE